MSCGPQSSSGGGAGAPSAPQGTPPLSLAPSATPPLVFLDVDGVLASMRCVAAIYKTNTGLVHDPMGQGVVPLDPVCISALHRLVTTADAHIVVTSTWRRDRGLKAFLLYALKEAGLGHRVLGYTPVLGDRGREVVTYLTSRGVDAGGHPFVVLDDEHTESFHAANLGPRFVRTDIERGLTMEDVDKALGILCPPCTPPPVAGGPPSPSPSVPPSPSSPLLSASSSTPLGAQLPSCGGSGESGGVGASRDPLGTEEGDREGEGQSSTRRRSSSSGGSGDDGEPPGTSCGPKALAHAVCGGDSGGSGAGTPPPVSPGPCLSGGGGAVGAGTGSSSCGAVDAGAGSGLSGGASPKDQVTGALSRLAVC